MPALNERPAGSPCHPSRAAAGECRDRCTAARPARTARVLSVKGKAMDRRSPGTVIPFPARGSAPVRLQRTSEDRIEVARRLGAEIATAADADRWSISIEGADVIGSAPPAEPPRHPVLRVLRAGPPATYRLVLPLSTSGRDLGVIRLATVRPGGFRPANVARASEAAEWAARCLQGIGASRNRNRAARTARRHNRPGARPLPGLSRIQWSRFPPDAC